MTAVLKSYLKSLKPATGEDGPVTVFMLSIAYGSVKKMVDTIAAEVPGLEVCRQEVDVPALTTPDDVVDLVRRTMPPSTRFAVFDHVTSNTG